MSTNKPLFSSNYDALSSQLCASKNLLIIQDLDGVCMGLVQDPLSRQISTDYVLAAAQLDRHFFVLSNGEHIGRRGVNGILEKAFKDRRKPRNSGLLLPGLGGGGVQWQDRHGTVAHPGVSKEELDFLRSVPKTCIQFFRRTLHRAPYNIPDNVLESLIAASILDNLVSPTVNINNFFMHFQESPELYRHLQKDMEQLMASLLQSASQRGLNDSFFVHYAPNLGRDEHGERIKYCSGEDSGTTDFQFMLRGAVKEAGVLVILNHYYYVHTGHYPLGREFNVRVAPSDPAELLKLVQDHFDPAAMPTILAVGDTITSQEVDLGEGNQVLRGGSDRGFLTLVQDIGISFGADNAVVFIDSSGGEVRRPSVGKLPFPAVATEWSDSHWQSLKGISDPADPLWVNYCFSGHEHYVDWYCGFADRFASA